MTLSKTFKSNVATLMVGRQSDGRSIWEASQSLVLDRQKGQHKEIIKLRVGRFIVRTAGCPTPFKIRVPPLEIRKDVDPDLLAERTLRIEAQPRVNLIARPKAVRLTEEEKQFIRFVGENPGANVTGTYEGLGLSRGRGDRLKTKLIMEGFLEEFSIATGRRGGMQKILALTGQGREALELGDNQGKGGLKHKTLQQAIKRYMEARGYRAEVEDYVEGHLVDVACYRGKEKISIQVAQSAKNELSNIQKSLPSFDKVVVACANRSVMAQIRKQAEAELSGYELEKVSFCLEGRFLERGGKG